MEKIDEFEKTIKELGFRLDRDGYNYKFYNGTRFYKLSYEGYAYVLYQQVNIYIKPLMNLFVLYNKFKKGSAQITLHYEVPIAHFRDPNKLRQFIKILNTKFD